MKYKLVLALVFVVSSLRGNPPELVYIYPAGGQRGTEVPIRAGGLFLHDRCEFKVPGLNASAELLRTKKLWFEGPLLPIPESQRQEDYPSDYRGSIRIPQDTRTSATRVRVRTAQGIASGPIFVVGELPEVVEQEIDGQPIAELVKLGTTLNGRLFPREDLDYWDFEATAGKTITALAYGSSIASPVVPRLDLLDQTGQVIASQLPYPLPGSDVALQFQPRESGRYRLRVMDARQLGGPGYVYRVTLTDTVQVNPHTLAMPTGLLSSDKTTATHSAPIALNGRIAHPGQVEAWKVHLESNVNYDFQLVARHAGSPLWGRLSLAAETGQELAKQDSTEASEARLSWTAKRTGLHVLRVQDQYSNRGGEAFLYQLRIVKKSEKTEKPGFRLTLPNETVSLFRGASAQVRVAIDRDAGFNAPITLRVQGLPETLKVTIPKINTNQNTADISISVPADSPSGSHTFQVVGQAELSNEKQLVYAESKASKLVPGSSQLELVIGIPSPFKIVDEYMMTTANRGEVYRRRYRLDRGGYDGPIEIQIAEKQARHLQGVTGPGLTVAPGQTEFEYPFFLPPWMEMGRTCRCCIMAVAKVYDPIDKKNVVLSFSSRDQNQQMIVVVGPGRLGLDVAKSSLLVVAGQEQTIAVKISRSPELTGPVKVEAVLPEHWKGLKIDPIVIPAGQTQGVLKVRADAMSNLWNDPLVLRATLTTKESSITAEATIELVRSLP